MSETDKCPKCGSRFIELAKSGWGSPVDVYACGTGVWPESVHQSPLCRIRELEAENGRLGRDLLEANSCTESARHDHDTVAAEAERLEAENERLRGIVARLVEHMKQWARDEDGVPDYAYDDYRQAVEAAKEPGEPGPAASRC